MNFLETQSTGIQQLQAFPSREPLSSRLEREISDLESRIADKRKALEILKRNPEVEELINILACS